MRWSGRRCRRNGNATSLADAKSSRYINAMPTYEYELCEGDCKACGGRFSINRPMDREPLENCPLCKKPVRKVFSTFSTPKVSGAASISNAKNAGFTVLKKIGKGEYEKQ